MTVDAVAEAAETDDNGGGRGKGVVDSWQRRQVLGSNGSGGGCKDGP